MGRVLEGHTRGRGVHGSCREEGRGGGKGNPVEASARLKKNQTEIEIIEQLIEKGN
jgi:hypothetical protein